MEQSTLKEYVFKTDNKYQPLVLKDKEAKYTLIVRLLLMEPGTIQTHPEMGIGLVSRYRYSDVESVMVNLKKDINEQMRKYLPLELQTSTVTLSRADNQLVLNITVDGESAQLSIDDNGNYKLSEL